MLSPEFMALLDNADIILGSDEAGLGAWAGPLVASAVLVPKGWAPPAGLTDSKKMTGPSRRATADALAQDRLVFSTTLWASATEVDAENVYYANIRLHTALVVHGLAVAAEMYPGKKVLAVVDGNLKIPGAVSLPKADAKVRACSAASVLAKVARDTWMEERAREYPGYGFESHVGYGGDASHPHNRALGKLGPCPIHRKSFAPIAKLLKTNEPDVMDLIAELDRNDP